MLATLLPGLWIARSRLRPAAAPRTKPERN